MVQQVADHYREAVARLTRQPATIGHSFGGLLAQTVASEGGSIATVAIDSAPIKGVLPRPGSALKSASPVLAHPGNRNKAVALTFEQFQYGWTNNLDEAEARRLYDTYHVPASGAPLFQAAFANVNPSGGETAVEVKDPARVRSSSSGTTTTPSHSPSARRTTSSRERTTGSRSTTWCPGAGTP